MAINTERKSKDILDKNKFDMLHSKFVHSAICAMNKKILALSYKSYYTSVTYSGRHHAEARENQCVRNQKFLTIVVGCFSLTRNAKKSCWKTNFLAFLLGISMYA